MISIFYRASVIAGVALGVAVPAAAGAGWSGAVNLSAVGDGADSPDLVVDPSGAATAVWRFNQGGTRFIQASRYSGGGWSPPVNISEPGANAFYDPKVAVDSSGVVTAVWQRADAGGYALRASRYSGGAWSPPVGVAPVAPKQAKYPQIAVDAAGVVTAVWRRNDGTNDIIQASRYAGGSWSSPVDISVGGQDATRPALAVDNEGVVTAVWYRSNGTHDIIQASRYLGGLWSNPVNLSAPGENARQASVAVDSSRVVTAVWRRNSIIQASRYAGGNWSSPVNLSAAGQNAQWPDVAVDPSGVVTAVWRRYNGSNYIIQASRYAGGSWSSPVNLSAAGQNASSSSSLAVDTAGIATAAWVRWSGSNWITQVSRYAGSSWSSPVNLSVVGQDAGDPRVAVDGSGAATVVWYSDLGTAQVVQAARYVPDPPPGAAAATPAPLCSQSIYQQGKRTIRWNKKRQAYKVTSRIRIYQDAQKSCRTKLTVIYRNANTKIAIPQKSGSTLGYRKLKGKNFNAPVISWPTRKEMRFTTGDTTGQNRRNARLVMVSYLKKNKAVPKKLKNIELVIVRRIPRNPAVATSSSNPLFAQRNAFRTAKGWAAVG